MCKITLPVILGYILSINAISQPVYKIVLTQKGFAQFLQYDVVTPPIRQLTFCTWIRLYDLSNAQSIFSYFANSNSRIIKVWLETGGQKIKVSIDGKMTSSAEVDIAKDVWRHICFSYQSDYGAWALYIDSRLASCQAAKSLSGFVLPGGGSVIIGYGTGSDGEPNGFEGEIFGANMILASTIERNYTMRIDPLYAQKRFPRNKIKSDTNYNHYVVLNDVLNQKLSLENNSNSYKNHVVNSTKSFVRVQTPHSFIEHSVGVKGTTTQLPTRFEPDNYSNEASDFTFADFINTNQAKIDFWNIPKLTFGDMYKSQAKIEQSNAGTKVVPTVSEFETPPPPPSPSNFDNTFRVMPTVSTVPLKDYSFSNNTHLDFHSSHRQQDLAAVETPPPIQQNMKVYGQWTSSKFASRVLDYLKTINFNNRYPIIKRAPPAIPLHKISDTHPYPSEFKLNIIRPPSPFRRRNIVEKRYDFIRRSSQINVQILEDDLRSNIAKMHAETHPKEVEISNRGKPKNHRGYSQYNKENPNYNSSEKFHASNLTSNDENKNKNHRYSEQPTPLKVVPLKFPVSKSMDYILKDSFNSETQTTTTDSELGNIKSKNSLENGNKWHNAKSYNNDYTPRKFSTEDFDETEHTKKIYPAMKLRYNTNKQTGTRGTVDFSLLEGRKLASEISHQLYINKESVPLQTHDAPLSTQHNQGRKPNHAKRNMESENFDKPVKIGNALNERNVIGDNEDQERSFVGGDDHIPDINKFRSEIDDANGEVPPSLGPKVCKNVELYDRVLYVQQDESIDMTHILSPIREKNIAIQFVIQNYRKCSITDSVFQKNAMLLIDWNRTPVRLFGGAYPKITTDLCGFF